MTLLRKCVSCGKRYNKFSMVRINKSPKSEGLNKITVFDVGDQSYIPGRCCYVCCNLDCFQKAKKSSRIERNFRCKVCSDVYDKIENIVCSSEN